MSPKVQEIERAIGELSTDELQELYSWLDQHHRQPFDERIESDLEAGRLDRAVFGALEDEKNGRIRPL